MLLYDKADIELTRDADGKPRRTKDGYLTFSARAARTGIQIYKGKELGRPDLGEVAVYRPPEEVFNKDAMRSMAHKPLTLHHPPEAVTDSNWKKYAIGHSGDEVVRDGDFIRIPMVVMDGDAIRKIESGECKQLSVGYSTDLKWGKGKTADGLLYDAVQTDIRGNHHAAVPTARGGDVLCIGDAKTCSNCGTTLPASNPSFVQSCPSCGMRQTSDAGDDYDDDCPECGEEWDDDDKFCSNCGRKRMTDDAVGFYWDREFSEEQRKDLAKSGAAMPGGSFPISNTSDLRNAVKAVGRAKDYAAAKAHIISRAKALGATSELPDDWVKSTKDSLNGDVTMSTTLVIDGIPVEFVNDVGAKVVQKQISALQKQVADAKEKADKDEADDIEEKRKREKMETDAKVAMDAAAGKIAALEKQVKDAEVTPEILDKLVKDRMTVIGKASLVLDAKTFKMDGMKVEDIRREVVSKKFGDAFVKDRSDAYVEAVFDTIEAGKGGGGARDIADALSRPGYRDGTAVKANDAAYEEMVREKQNAWKPKTAAA
jgi:hypothetical protein